ncbi:MAG TPA: CHAT domain-containing protein [Anaerolineae bacterium]|nr:CHAT domain-containing protein [Anaerolineae bacterium]
MTPTAHEIYLHYAQKISHTPLTLNHASATTLPPLTPTLFNHLNQIALNHQYQTPRYSWTLNKLLVLAAQQTTDTRLQAQASWHLGRAANAWTRPDLLAPPLNHAQSLFEQLNMPAWTAASTWQLYAQPWLHAPFTTVANQLEQALTSLEQHHLMPWLPYCRQSLAMAYLLIGQPTLADQQLTLAHTEFTQLDDPIGLVLIFYTQARLARIQANYDHANQLLQQARHLTAPLPTPVLDAMIAFQQAHILMQHQGDYHTATQLFTQALTIFNQANLPLWQAQCQEGLVKVYSYNGSLTTASDLAAQSRQVYQKYQIPGLLASNLNTSAQLLQFKGELAPSLDYLRQAEAKFKQVGNRWLPSVALMNQGDIYLAQGHYQQALNALETAYRQFDELNNNYRLAAASWRLAQLWLQLNHQEQAAHYLTITEQLYQQLGHQEWLPQLYILQAEISPDTEKQAHYLRQAQQLAQTQNIPLLIATIARTQSELSLSQGEYDHALTHLQIALDIFTTNNMITEKAKSLLIYGQILAAQAQLTTAQTTWHQALTLIANDAPEIKWRLELELASAAYQQKNQPQSLHYYQTMLTTLGHLRRNIWQPALAGLFNAQTEQQLNHAVTQLTQIGDLNTTLQFIEESKAQTVYRNIHNPWQLQSQLPPALQNLVADIRWLQEKLQASQHDPLPNNQQLHQKFHQKISLYQQQLAQFEREQRGQLPPNFLPAFNLDTLQTYFNTHFTSQWAALNYYLHDDTLICLLLTPDNLYLHQQKMNGSIQLALRAVIQQRCQSSRTHQALSRLATWLLPPQLHHYLTPNTHLFIAPHHNLHQIPWSALMLTPDAPLVTQAIPTIVPSWQSLLSLWQKHPQRRTQFDHGLLLGVSHFDKMYHPPLTAVAHEINTLHHTLPTPTHTLTDTAATWPNLQKQTRHQYDFWHIATHAFVDKVSGRLSGIALFDQDVWLNELESLAPLPPLVTLSACQGLQSLRHAGDEMLGIVNTCLTAGTQTVIGSLWPLPDEFAPHIIQTFYQQLTTGQQPALALALTQRQLHHQHPIGNWAGFQSIGLP